MPPSTSRRRHLDAAAARAAPPPPPPPSAPPRRRRRRVRRRRERRALLGDRRLRRRVATLARGELLCGGGGGGARRSASAIEPPILLWLAEEERASSVAVHSAGSRRSATFVAACARRAKVPTAPCTFLALQVGTVGGARRTSRASSAGLDAGRVALRDAIARAARFASALASMSACRSPDDDGESPRGAKRRRAWLARLAVTVDGIPPFRAPRPRSRPLAVDRGVTKDSCPRAGSRRAWSSCRRVRTSAVASWCAVAPAATARPLHGCSLLVDRTCAHFVVRRRATARHPAW